MALENFYTSFSKKNSENNTDKVKIKKPASECTKKYMTEPVIF